MEKSLFDRSRSHVSPSHDLGGQCNESPKSPPPHHFFGITVTYFSNNGIPYNKLEGTFRAYGLDGAIQSGTLNVIYSVDSERDETVFGSYHAISLHFPDRIVQNGYVPPPPETLELDRLTPLVLGRFDGSDTIHSINPATLFGHRARCIQFETMNGRTRQSNEICVDEEQGNVIRWNVGEELVDSTEFSAFEGVLLPGHLRHYINGKLRMEVEQKFSVIDGPVDWAALNRRIQTRFDSASNTGDPSFSLRHNQPQLALDRGTTYRSTALSDQMGMCIRLQCCQTENQNSKRRRFRLSPDGFSPRVCATESPFP